MPSTRPGTVATRLREAALAAALSMLAAPAWSADREPCPTWFPDFRCDRSGRYEGFTIPITNPYLFEDPFITTGAYAVGIWHEFPDDSIFGGGNAMSADGGDLWAAALQLRVAITDRLAFIATKDGFVWLDPGNNAVFREKTGFMNIAGGFKYALIDRREDDFILSPSVRIEVPAGQNQVFQGYGDGIFIPGLSTAWGLGDFHVIADLGAQVPFSTKKQSTQFFYHLHLDYALLRHLVPTVELAGYHWTGSGNGRIRAHDTKLSPAPTLSTAQAALMTGRFEGQDVINLGSRGVKGNDVVTFAAGATIPLMDRVSLGAVYEFPITDREDIIDQRVTMRLSYEF